jgi:hypothetical protein
VSRHDEDIAADQADWSGEDDYDPYLDDPDGYDDYPEPPGDYLESEAERQLERHRDQAHGGGECNCPPYVPPSCRLLLRLPRWSPRWRWSCGTPEGCAVSGYRTPQAAWRAHHLSHTAPF